jgi:hypothetical protein
VQLQQHRGLQALAALARHGHGGVQHIHVRRGGGHSSCCGCGSLLPPW